MTSGFHGLHFKRISVRLRHPFLVGQSWIRSMSNLLLVMNQQVVHVRIWRRVPWTELGTGVRYTTPSNARFRDGLTRLQ